MTSGDFWVVCLRPHLLKPRIISLRMVLTALFPTKSPCLDESLELKSDLPGVGAEVERPGASRGGWRSLDAGGALGYWVGLLGSYWMFGGSYWVTGCYLVD